MVKSNTKFDFAYCFCIFRHILESNFGVSKLKFELVAFESFNCTKNNRFGIYDEGGVLSKVIC